MPSTFQPAEDLIGAAVACNLDPLESGDPRYVDFSPVRDFRLNKIVKSLETSLASGAYLNYALCGHRGSGKSTEILRLKGLAEEKGLEVFYVQVNEEVNPYDIEYSDLFLIIFKTIEEEMRGRGIALDGKILDNIARWYADVTQIRQEEIEKSISLGVAAKAGSDIPFVAKFIGYLKAGIKAGTKDTKEIKEKIQKFPKGLVDNVNLLLDEARNKLAARGKRDVLLIFDNLDRYAPDIVDALLKHGSDYLRETRCHFIMTLPINLAYKPKSVSLKDLFADFSVLPMIKLRAKNDSPEHLTESSVSCLKMALAKRIDLEKLFDPDAKDRLVSKLAAASGGSLRDLMHLAHYACLEAEKFVDDRAVDEAVRKLRISYQREIGPGDMEVLARAHLDKTSVNDERCSHLLFMRHLLEYVNDETWVDVHPVISQLENFKKALEKLKQERASSKADDRMNRV